MQVDVYALAGVLQALAYTAGECESMAKMLDSEKASRTLSCVGAELRNTADDVRMILDNLAVERGGEVVEHG